MIFVRCNKRPASEGGDRMRRKIMDINQTVDDAPRQLTTIDESRTEVLFDVCLGNTPTGDPTQGRQYDVSADGQKFLFICGNDAQDHYSVIANWQAKTK